MVVWGLDESRGGRGGYDGYGGYYGGYYSEYYGAGQQADSGARGTSSVAPARNGGGFVMPDEHAPLAKWRSGWRLGLAVFVAVAIMLAVIVLALNGWLGWFAL